MTGFCALITIVIFPKVLPPSVSACEQEIAKKESTLAVEKRTYMKGWLKKIFVAQAVITTILGGLMVSE